MHVLTKEASMHRTTVMLPADIKEKSLRQARKQGISFGRFVRAAIEARVRAAGVDEPGDDSLFGDDTVFSDAAPRRLAAEHDRFLYDEET
jgi:hypothetical protein